MNFFSIGFRVGGGGLGGWGVGGGGGVLGGVSGGGSYDLTCLCHQSRFFLKNFFIRAEHSADITPLRTSVLG